MRIDLNPHELYDLHNTMWRLLTLQQCLHDGLLGTAERWSLQSRAFVQLVCCCHWGAIVVQADGSAMYSLQALWTQAREKLHVITIICANRTYSILKVQSMVTCTA